ncbi:MAG: tetratricopeptide repeat protein, partial [Bacteroidia bacterium]|nr:tetratricopeptide repeat protein [Bacteroidia bacterium]
SANTTLTSETKISEIKLDTFELTDYNFRRLHRISNTTVTFNTLTALPGATDTMELLNLAPHNITEKGIQTTAADKLKFAINSPITYLHDLKITDYQKLYFKRVFSSRETGIPAAFADRDDMWSGQPRLKANATDYLHEEISRAMNHFRKRDYNACIYSLNLVSGFNENDVNCSFYLGMCYYYKTNYDRAQLYFNQCLENSNNAFYQEARYYKALTLSESGNSSEAISLLKQIAEDDDFYSLKAKEVLVGLK